VALGGFARTLLLVGAVISMLGHTGAMILATPRMLFAFARDGFLPGGLARLHPAHQSPVAAILLPCVIVLVLAIASTFERLAILANIFDPRDVRHVLPGDVAVAPPRRARRRHAIQSPAPASVILLACLMIGWMLMSVTAAEWIAFAIGLAVASVIFAFRRKRGRDAAPAASVADPQLAGAT
jgi:APA family basic amino acid/polyamine antiporter